MRPTSCDIDLQAIRDNVGALASLVTPTPLCAVVKANGYGHGSVQVALAALEAGASWLAVALVEEGVELRDAGIDAPILLLSEATPSAADTVVDRGLTPTVYSDAGIAAISAAAHGRGPIDVHLCVDSGMRRVGVELSDMEACATAISDDPDLELSAIWTHCPVADEPGNDFTDEQLRRFSGAADAHGIDVDVHVANSAVALTRPTTPGLMVRCGIAIYGIAPASELAGLVDLRPAMTVRSEVSFVKSVPAGQGVGYGHRYTTGSDSTIVTVPIGYADGVRRDLGLRGGHVLIGGMRHPIVGVVTMDQLMVDVGGTTVAVGDEVILLGRQGNEQITATEIAEQLGTIPYEIVCAISSRMPRRYI